jgi:hypothetical protein
MIGLKFIHMNRCRFLKLAPLLVAITTLLWGVNVTGVRADTTEADRRPPHAIRDPKVDPNLTPAQRARVTRKAEFKKKQDVRKYVKDVVEGEQSAPPGNRGKGGAK